MTTQVTMLKRYEADEGKVFDYKEPRFETREDGTEEQVHLYAKILFMGDNDNISNYVEIDKPKEE